MAKQYRKPTNEVTVIYGGRSPAGRDTLNPKDVLPNGMTAKQHCEKLIAERGGKGHFIEKILNWKMYVAQLQLFWRLL